MYNNRMKQSIYVNHTPTLQQVALIESGKSTRSQAAEALGISVGTLNSRLTRAKLVGRLKGTRPPVTAEQAKHHFKPDHDKAKVYEEAVAIAMSRPRLKVNKLQAMFPSLSYQMLARKVKAAHEAAELAELQAKVQDRANLEREITEASEPQQPQSPSP